MNPSPIDTPTATDYGATLLRLTLGTMWIAHALLKRFVFTLPGTAQFFDSVGYPGWMAYPVFAVELIGGLMLVVGFYARQVSLALVPVMLAATWVHLPNGWLCWPWRPWRCGSSTMALSACAAAGDSYWVTVFDAERVMPNGLRHPLILVSHTLCPYVQRAAIVLTEKGVLFERRWVDLANNLTGSGPCHRWARHRCFWLTTHPSLNRP
jgi:putative oxidoreductase